MHVKSEFSFEIPGSEIISPSLLCTQHILLQLPLVSNEVPHNLVAYHNNDCFAHESLIWAAELTRKVCLCSMQCWLG